MKRRKFNKIVVAVILALSLSFGGLASGTWITHSEEAEIPISPEFTAHPQGQIVFAGQNVVFSVAVAGTPSPLLQWQISSNGGVTWTNIDGQTAATLRLNSVTLAQNNNMFRCIATNTAAEVISGIANLTVSTAPAAPIEHAHIPLIGSQPSDGTVLVNGSVTLSVTASVTDRGTLSYQWFSNTTDRNTGGTLIRGATSRTFAPPTNTPGTMYYYVVITNTNNYVNGNRTASVTSTTARVAANALVHAQTPEITTQPDGDSVLRNGRITLSVAAQVRDNGTLSFQWFRNTTNSNTGGTPVNGATGAVFAPETDTLGVHYYYVVITNTNNNANINGTRTATVSSRAVPVTVITTPGAPQNLNALVDGNTVTLSWEAPANNGNSEIIGYQVSDNLVTIWIDANGTYEHTFEGLAYDREYTFMVRAINDAGNGEAAELTATTEDRETVYVTGMFLDRRTLEMHVGEYTTLHATITPRDADDQSVIWSTSDSAVAIVDENGLVTALSAGTAVITATTNDGVFTATSTVTVESLGNNLHFLWIGLGALAPIGTGTGIYLWKRKR